MSHWLLLLHFHPDLGFRVFEVSFAIPIIVCIMIHKEFVDLVFE